MQLICDWCMLVSTLIIPPHFRWPYRMASVSMWITWISCRCVCERAPPHIHNGQKRTHALSVEIIAFEICEITHRCPLPMCWKWQLTLVLMLELDVIAALIEHQWPIQMRLNVIIVQEPSCLLFPVLKLTNPFISMTLIQPFYSSFFQVSLPLYNWFVWWRCSNR